MPDAQTFADINQGSPLGLFSSLTEAWWGSGSLGNMHVQRIGLTDESLPTEGGVQTRSPFSASDESTSPRTRLSALKAARFTVVDRTERIQRSLQALNQPLGIDLPPAQWALVAEQIEDDEE